MAESTRTTKVASSQDVPVARTPEVAEEDHPFQAAVNVWDSFRGEMDRAFDRFSRAVVARQPLWRSPEVHPLGRLESVFGVAMPPVDVTETETEFTITAELPGLEAKDIEVLVEGGTITLKGEKGEAVDRNEAGCRLSERRYGAFQRTFRIPEGTDADKVGAKFDKGVLTIALPKSSEDTAKVRKVPVA